MVIARFHPAALCLAIALVACRDRPAPRAAGDDGWGPDLRGPNEAEPIAPAPRPNPIPPQLRVRWAHATLAVNLERVPGRERSEHIDGSYDRTVRVNERAKGYLTLAGDEALPEGSLILQDHHPAGADSVAVTFAMAKLEQDRSKATRDWSFAVLDAELREAAGGDLALCARCHLEAPHGSLFGPPASPTMK